VHGERRKSRHFRLTKTTQGRTFIGTGTSNIPHVTKLCQLEQDLFDEEEHFSVAEEEDVQANLFEEKLDYYSQLNVVNNTVIEKRFEATNYVENITKIELQTVETVKTKRHLAQTKESELPIANRYEYQDLSDVDPVLFRCERKMMAA
jgi:hypothetical protein